jgi:hypothetical protein
MRTASKILHDSPLPRRAGGGKDSGAGRAGPLLGGPPPRTDRRGARGAGIRPRRPGSGHAPTINASRALGPAVPAGRTLARAAAKIPVLSGATPRLDVSIRTVGTGQGADPRTAGARPSVGSAFGTRRVVGRPLPSAIADRSGGRGRVGRRDAGHSAGESAPGGRSLWGGWKLNDARGCWKGPSHAWDTVPVPLRRSGGTLPGWLHSIERGRPYLRGGRGEGGTPSRGTVPT